MKTIYINTNGENIQSTDDVIVIGGASDAIVDAFFIELGMGILAKAHVRGVSNKSIMTDFAQSQPDDFKMISEQWEELKEILLGDDPTGTFDVTLPAEFLHWLHYNENQAYIEVYDNKYRGQKQAVISINVEGLYEDSVDALRRKAVKYLEQNDNADDFSDYELVVNDDLVTRNSKLVGDIKKKCTGIAFVPFGKFEWVTKEDKNKGDVSKAPLILSGTDWNDFFTVNGIVLGKTSIYDVAGRDSNLRKYDKGFEYEFADECGIYQKYEDDFITSMRIGYLGEGFFPQKWEKNLGFSFKTSEEKCELGVKNAGLTFVEMVENEYGHTWLTKTPDSKYLMIFWFQSHYEWEVKELLDIRVKMLQCPYCGSKNVGFKYIDYHGHTLFCNKCSREWGDI